MLCAECGETTLLTECYYCKYYKCLKHYSFHFRAHGLPCGSCTDEIVRKIKEELGELA